MTVLYITVLAKSWSIIKLATKWGFNQLIGDDLNIGLYVLNNLKEENSQEGKNRCNLNLLCFATFSFCDNLFADLSWHLICDAVVLSIYFDHKFQWPQEILNWFQDFVRIDSRGFFFKSRVKIVTTFTTFSSFESSSNIILL